MEEIEKERRRQSKGITTAYDEMMGGEEVSYHQMAQYLRDPNFGPALEYIAKCAFSRPPYPQDTEFAHLVHRHGGLTPVFFHYQVQIIKATAEVKNLFPFRARIDEYTGSGKCYIMQQIWLITKDGAIKPFNLEPARFSQKTITEIGQTLFGKMPEIGWAHTAEKSIVVIVTALYSAFNCVRLTIIKPPENPADFR